MHNCDNRQRIAIAYSQPQIRHRTRLLAAVSETGKTDARSAGSPGLPAELSRNSVVFRYSEETVKLIGQRDDVGLFLIPWINVRR